MQFKLIALLTLAVASVNAAAVHKRFGGTCNCGGNAYGSTNIAAAVSQSKTGPHGFNSYPHTYKNHEGFTFAGCTGTLAEFPILKNGKVFDGSSGPGPDRIILDASGGVCGCITHTGALPGGFHQCT